MTFTDHDVTKDKEALKKMIQISAQLTVPVIDVNGKVLVGFDRDKLDAALKAAK